MDFLARYVAACWTLVVPLLLCLASSVVLFLLGEKEAAWWVGNAGTWLVVVLNAAYVLIFDPLGRWKKP